ncbi:MAG: DNA-binding protein [Rhizobiales bacterium 17-65-6]|nr:MAG: DNA-binding protein [Rhizobiales bacterium 17-65-6]
MIYSDKQYAISERQLGNLREALTAAKFEKADATSEHSWVRAAQADAIKSQIATLEAELSHYALLKSGEITFAKTHSLENLPSVLVQARIAAGLSQTDLAERLGMKAQQIQRYEASDYSGASLDRLIDVCQALNVHTTGVFESDNNSRGSVFSWSNIDDVVWKQFPAREMAKRGWFDVPRKGDVYKLARDYFMRVAGPQFASAYHRKKMHGGSVPNEYALLAWQARILERSQEIVETHKAPDFIADDRWIADLVALTRFKDGPKRAQALLLSKGIILITEKHLSGTYLDGAAMLDRNSRPVIGLTLRFDRLDNFWFVLLHELGHVFLHLMDGLRYDFFDEEDTAGDDKVERDADAFALDSLIPESKWDECLSRFALSEEAVRIDAKNLGIDPSIIAGRIRKERGDYTILGGLIGQDQVASQFKDDGDELV